MKFLATTGCGKSSIITIYPMMNNTFEYSWEGQSRVLATEALSDYLVWVINEKWKNVTSGFDPNDIQGLDNAWFGGNKPCCGGGTNGGLYVQGKWHDMDCDTLKPVPLSALPGYTAPAQSIPQPTNLGRCTCGSSSVGSDRHSSYCDLYVVVRR